MSKQRPPYTSRGLGMDWYEKPTINTKPIAGEREWILFVGYDLYAFSKWSDAMTFLGLNYDRITKEAERNLAKWRVKP